MYHAYTPILSNTAVRAQTHYQGQIQKIRFTSEVYRKFGFACRESFANIPPRARRAELGGSSPVIRSQQIVTVASTLNNTHGRQHRTSCRCLGDCGSLGLAAPHDKEFWLSPDSRPVDVPGIADKRRRRSWCISGNSRSVFATANRVRTLAGFSWSASLA